MALELERVGERTLLARGPANCGVFETRDGGAILVDSGSDDDAGRKLLRACEARGLRVDMIVNTHSNADHCGGNAFIQSRTGCSVAATAVEAAFIANPVLEPSYLWGGGPPPVLKTKFLMARPSRVTRVLEPPCEIVPGLRAVPLPGHFFGMIGVLADDGVFFAADAVAGVDILEKYHIFFLYDIGAQLETLESLGNLGATLFVPSHAAPTRDPEPLLRANRDKIIEVASVVEGLCAAGPATAEDLLASLAGHYGIELNHAQHALVGSTLRSYLSWMIAGKRIVSRVEGNRMLFSKGA